AARANRVGRDARRLRAGRRRPRLARARRLLRRTRDGRPPQRTQPLGRTQMSQIDHYLTADDLAASLRRDVRAGLTSTPKVLPPKYLYAGPGSELFEHITRLPEYYQTRAEATILGERADDIADLTKARTSRELSTRSSQR